MSVTVLSLPEREANSAASFSDSETLLLFACVVDAERGMAFLAKHAAGAAVGGLAKTLVAVWIERVSLHLEPQERKIPIRNCGQATGSWRALSQPTKAFCYRDLLKAP